MHKYHSFKLYSLILCVCMLSACAQKTMYEWGSYNGSLLNYYKSPGEIEEFAQELEESIAKAESEQRVPPGLYAEYGYVMLELGDEDRALEYFARERQLWPESAFLMTKVINRLSGGSPADDGKDSGDTTSIPQE